MKNNILTSYKFDCRKFNELIALKQQKLSKAQCFFLSDSAFFLHGEPGKRGFRSYIYAFIRKSRYYLTWWHTGKTFFFHCVKYFLPFFGTQFIHRVVILKNIQYSVKITLSILYFIINW